jgi:hypothetical protein
MDIPTFVYPLGSVIVGLLLPLLVGLLFLMFAGRLVTRVVLDEIRKDHARRGAL